MITILKPALTSRGNSINSRSCLTLAMCILFSTITSTLTNVLSRSALAPYAEYLLPSLKSTIVFAPFFALRIMLFCALSVGSRLIASLMLLIFVMLCSLTDDAVRAVRLILRYAELLCFAFTKVQKSIDITKKY